LTLSTAGGLEVLMHIGIDTIQLKGKGFTPKVKNGDRVRAGAAPIDFDADFIATHAKSLLSLVIITNPEKVTDFHRSSGNVIAGSDVVLELELASDQALAAPAAGTRITSAAILIPNSSGWHARPAAVLANIAKRYTSDVWVQRGEAKAHAKSITSLLNLDVRHADEVSLVAQGQDASDAVNALLPLIMAGLGEEGTPAPASRTSMKSPDPHPCGTPAIPSFCSA
jgi:phosphocarrier protein FPr